MAPPPTPNPAGYSPEILAWLMGQGPNPFATYEDTNSQVISNWDLPQDPDDIGTFEFQNSRLTGQNKANDQYSDFAQIAQLGTGAGGFGPEMFESTYEPVDAPGYQQMMFYQTSSDPIMKFVAQRFSDKATASQVLGEVQTLIESGDPEFSEGLFMVEDDFGNKVPDWSSIKERIYDLEKSIISDPQYEQGPDGMPVREVKSEAAQWFAERGLPSPWEIHDPDMFAEPEQLRQEREVVPFAAQRTDREAKAMLAKMLEGERTAASEGFAKARRSPGYNPSRAEMPILPNTVALPSSALGVADTGRRSTRAGDRYTRSDRSSGRAKQKARQPVLSAKRDSTAFGKAYVAQQKALQAQEDARYAQMERQRLAEAAARAGYTPFNDVNRPRQGNIYGF